MKQKNRPKPENYFNKLLIKCVLFRLMISLFIVMIGNMFTPLDASAKLTVKSVLYPLCNWDGIHFTQIALNGYQYEHNCAFFPLYPLLLRFIGKIFSIPIAGILINLITFSISFIYLYKLTILKLKDEKFAFLTVKLFAITPALPFHCALYSESTFTCLFIVGYYEFICKRYFFSTLCWMFASFCRSNGILFAGFYGWESIQQLRQLTRSFRLLFHAAFVVIPFILIQTYFWWNGVTDSLFCYSKIQAKYW